jgi:hypothetical protein
MTQRKCPIEHGAHEGKNRHREHHLDQGETFLRPIALSVEGSLVTGSSSHETIGL